MNSKVSIPAIILIVLACFGYCWWSKHNIELRKVHSIQIGAILPLTGDLAKYGESGNNGLTVALDEFRRNNGNFKGDIIIEDDKGEVKTALAAVNKLFYSDKTRIIVGAMASGVTLGIAPELNKNKVVLIAPTSTASEVTKAGDFIFRVCVSDAFEGKSMADYLSKHFKSSRIGVVYINNDYGIGLKKNFVESALNSNLNIVIENGYNPKQSDFRVIINKLKNEHIDLLYIVAQKEQIDFFAQCKELNFKPQFTGSTMLEDKELIDKLGNFLNGTLYTYRSYNAVDSGITTKTFVDSYKMKYNQVPDFYAASTYDATKLALQAAYYCFNNNIEPKDYLYNLKNFNGVTGLITFDKYGDVQQGFSIKIINNSEFNFND